MEPSLSLGTCVSELFDEVSDTECGTQSLSEVESEDSSTKSGKHTNVLTASTEKKVGRNIKPVSDKELVYASSPEKGEQQHVACKSTLKCIQWCLTVWRAWAEERNSLTCDPNDKYQKVPQNILELNDEELNFWLSKFVVEIKKKNPVDDLYPPNTLRQLCCGLQRHVRDNGRPELDIFGGAMFKQFKRIFVNRLQRLLSEGCGVTVRQPESLSVEHEDILWSKSLLGDSSPRVLLNTLVFLIGKSFYLRSGREHRSIKYGQFWIESDATCNAGKPEKLCFLPSQERLDLRIWKDTAVKPKPKKLEANLKNPARCIVRLYKFYISKCPTVTPESFFYMMPKRHFNPVETDWFTPDAVGHNTLGTVVKKLCEDAGIEGYHNNHSLLAPVRITASYTGVNKSKEDNREEMSCEQSSEPAGPSLQPSEQMESSNEESPSTAMNSGRSETGVASPRITVIPTNVPSSSNNENGHHDEKRDGKDILLTLKNQVSFARQCLGLLQNQMKHAIDTLNILQDQVAKAESTIEKLESRQNSQSLAPKIKSIGSVAPGCEYHNSQGEITPGTIQGHRMIVLDSNGQTLYAIDKPGTTFGVPVPHHIHGSPCPCPSCTTMGVRHHVLVEGQGLQACTDQSGQVIAVHQGQPLYQYAVQPTVPLTTVPKEPAKYDTDQVRSQEEHHTHCESRASSTVSVTPTASTTEVQQVPQQANHGLPVIESTMSFKGTKSSKSSSPIATQLLQVIDVLSADDDDNRSRSPSTLTVDETGYVHSSSQPFTGPIPYPVNPPSQIALAGSSRCGMARRSRKQDMSPVKKEEPRKQDCTSPSHVYELDVDIPGLMRVPAPVLASTLEPEFLVVPGSSYFWESPSATSTSSTDRTQQEKQDIGTHEDTGTQHTEIEQEEDATTTCLVKVKKERQGPSRSCSLSSQSQTSEGYSSRSSSASSGSEKCAVRCLDMDIGTSNRNEASCRVSSRREEDDERDNRHPQEVNVVFSLSEGSSSNTLHNGTLSILNVCSIASATENVTTGFVPARGGSPSSKSVVQTTKSSPLNSMIPHSSSHSGDSAGMAALPKPAVSRVTRAQKPSPLNTMIPTTVADNEDAPIHLTRSATLRGAHASPLNSVMPISLQENNKSVNNPVRVAQITSPAVSPGVRSSGETAFIPSLNQEYPTTQIPSYSVAQLGGDGHTTCTSPKQATSKRPNILNRNRHGIRDIPEGIVVLVPTIEDAKKLIQSTGNNTGSTPVLVPQNILHQLNSNGESKGVPEVQKTSSAAGKRPHTTQPSSSLEPAPKRINSGAVILD